MTCDVARIYSATTFCFGPIRVGMNPRSIVPFWQHAAQRPDPRNSGFAIGPGRGNFSAMLAKVPDGVFGGQDCYPFPFPWFGPQRAGPFFTKSAAAFWHLHAICVRIEFFRFVFPRLAVESPSITTNKRGRTSSCGKPLSCLHFFPPRLPAVCKTLQHAVLPGRWRVPHLPILPTITHLQARLLVVWLGLQPAASTWACPPVTDLKPAHSAAAGSIHSIQRPSGLTPRLAAFVPAGPVLAHRRSLPHV